MKIAIYQTSDLHGFVYPTNYVTEKQLGILKIGSYILKDKKNYDASLTIDCGDLVQGSSLTHYLSKKNPEVNPIVQCLEKIGYDAYVLGNHEFNYGLDYLTKAYTPISEKVINANIEGLAFKSKPYKIFDNSIRKQYISSNMVVRNFETAMKKGEFEVYLQPVFDAKTRKMASAEALIRWKYQGDKLISPAVFIPALEDSGQISLLDLFVIKTVKNYQERRRKSGKTNIPISMNLSWMDFYDTKMIDWILDDLQQNPTPQNVVRYEITETSYAAIAENRQNVLDEFKSRNAKIMLDDFGSGYSSFSMLQSYDFDILKLDMGFVRKIESSEKTREIIKSIIGMAHRIGAKIVAEGAETDQQVEFLKENDCDYIQGYYFSKPLPQKEFEAYVEEYWDNDKVFEK